MTGDIGLELDHEQAGVRELTAEDGIRRERLKAGNKVLVDRQADKAIGGEVVAAVIAVQDSGLGTCDDAGHKWADIVFAQDIEDRTPTHRSQVGG